MGNKIARTTQASATEYYLHELPSAYNLVLVDVVSRGRFLKSVRCKHDEGLLFVKVYFKRAGEPLDLKEHERRLERIRNAFEGLEGSHVWPFQVWLQTDKAAYLLRQYFYSNLHDRLSTRPFLSQIEKKWLAFQLIHAVEQSHSKGVCHGDIKCENVLVTSWNWLYLADFASFKPTYIPDDDPSDFSFFFDTGGRRRCYLAPERFYGHGGEAQVAADAPLQPSMDIFSLGPHFSTPPHPFSPSRRRLPLPAAPPPPSLLPAVRGCATVAEARRGGVVVEAQRGGTDPEQRRDIRRRSSGGRSGGGVSRL